MNTPQDLWRRAYSAARRAEAATFAAAHARGGWLPGRQTASVGINRRGRPVWADNCHHAAVMRAAARVTGMGISTIPAIAYRAAQAAWARRDCGQMGCPSPR